MSLRALGSGDADALHALARRPEVARYGDHEVDAPLEDWVEWLGRADNDRRVTLGALRGDRLEGAAQLTMGARRRQLHTAELALLVPYEGAAEIARGLIAALLDLADRWLQVVRLTHRAPAAHPYIGEVFGPAGFVEEGVRRRAVRRDGALADEALLARVASEVVTSREGPPFAVPPRGAPVRAIVAPMTVEDAAAMARILGDPRVAWGTLQLPFQRVDAWEARLEDNDPARIVSLGARVDGEVVGTGSLVIAPQPRRGHCGALGMGIDPAFQGRSVGRQLLDALLAAADARGLSRVELEVWEDNERARRLYASRGFEVECVERAIGYREGAFVTDLSMARLRGAALDR